MKLWNKHKHLWDQWTPYTSKVCHYEWQGVVPIKITRIELRQRRKCMDCGFTEDKHIAYTNKEEQ